MMMTYDRTLPMSGYGIAYLWYEYLLVLTAMYNKQSIVTSKGTSRALGYPLSELSLRSGILLRYHLEMNCWGIA